MKILFNYMSFWIMNTYEFIHRQRWECQLVLMVIAVFLMYQYLMEKPVPTDFKETDEIVQALVLEKCQTLKKNELLVEQFLYNTQEGIIDLAMTYLEKKNELLYCFTEDE